MSRSFTLRLVTSALLLLTATAAVTLTPTASGNGARQLRADPFYCVVIRDSQGNPINTTCVPSPFPLTRAQADVT